MGKIRRYSQESNDDSYVKFNMPPACQLGQRCRRAEHVLCGWNGEEWETLSWQNWNYQSYSSAAMYSTLYRYGARQPPQRVIFGDWISRVSKS